MYMFMEQRVWYKVQFAWVWRSVPQRKKLFARFQQYRVKDARLWIEQLQLPPRLSNVHVLNGPVTCWQAPVQPSVTGVLISFSCVFSSWCISEGFV